MKEDVANNPSTLVILSLPFQRLVRSHLSLMVLEILTSRANVIIVSPFTEHSDFVAQYRGERIAHESAHTHESLPWPLRKLVAISSILRIQGYRYRIRNLLPYYWATRHIKIAENGNETTDQFLNRLITDILAWLGSWSKAWILLDKLIGRWSYYVPSMASAADKYQSVTLIQAASWGFQDQALGWMGRKFGWRTVLLPYTSDQLMTNGYLYSDFDAVCVQGPMERRFAAIFHKVAPSRVVNLGSTYIRVLKAIPAYASGNRLMLKRQKPRVMYAGLVPTYFPTVREIEAVNMLSDLSGSKDPRGIDLVYRPAAFSEESLDAIKCELDFPERVELQRPSPTSLGLASYLPADSNLDLERLITDLKKVDVLVTSLTTSLSIEAALVGVPTVSYYPESDASLRARDTHLLFNKQNRTIGLESVPVAKDLQELRTLVNRLLDDSALRREIVEATVREWDYPDSNYRSLLEDAVFSDA